MPWKRATFKSNKVWVEVDDAGQPVVDNGLARIRYSQAPGAKIYSGRAAGLSEIEGDAQALPVAGAPATSGGGGRSSSGGGRPGRRGRGSGYGSAGTRTAAQAAAARADAAAQIAALPDTTHLIFTDGACKGNPGPAGAGAVVKLAGGEILEDSRYLGRATNNVGELTAVEMALDLLDGAGVAADAHAVLFTDSQYVNGVLTQGWKAKANRDLILGIRARLRARSNFEVRWIAGHVGVPENERADALAVAAIARGR